MTDQEQPLSPSAPGMSDEEEARAARLANRFDIRRLIGGVFLLYGTVDADPRHRRQPRT